MTWPADRRSAHRALLYTGEPEVRAAVGTFIRDGLARGEQVLAALPAGRLASIEAELGQAALGVEFADAAGFYRHQGRMTRTLTDWLRRHASDGKRVRVVAEQPLAARTPVEVTDYLRMEAAANLLYEPFPVSVLCPYHVAALPSGLRRAPERTHPQLLQDGRIVTSPRFADPRTVIQDYSTVVRPPATAASAAFAQADDLAAVRRFLRAELDRAGLTGDPGQLLLTATGEALTNALVHGGPPRRVWVYRESSMLVCHVQDGGPGFADPIAPYLPPEPGAPRGQGLWLGRQACDSLEVASGVTGTHVRLLTRLPDSGGPAPSGAGPEGAGP